MGANNGHMNWPAFYRAHDTKVEEDAKRKLDEERRASEAEMSVRLANLAMPEDIKNRAEAWGMSSWAEVLWNNAFQAGYREAMRSRKEPDD